MSIDAGPTTSKETQLDGLGDGDDRLCANCRAIDFDKIFHMRNTRSLQTKGYGLFLHDLSYATEPSCNLCSIFTALKQAEHKKRPTSPKWRLVGRSAQLRFSNHLPDSTLLSVEPSAAVENNPTDLLLFVRNDDRLSGRLVSDTVDWPLVTQWLHFCEKHHSKRCGLSLEFEIPGFRLIDCECRTVVNFIDSHPAYVTLSYVWGQHDVEAMQEGLRTGLPRTIDDAIVTVKRLGLQYLWVDRYCIDQRNTEQQARLIKNMGKIYSNSVLTIIAAAGDGPDHGLPGVTTTPRTAQSCFRTGRHVLTKFSTNDRKLIDASTWNSRGWTLQEALLSRRKLVFTDHYVVFQCSTMHCAENLSVPLEALHTKNMQGFRSQVYLSRPFPIHGVGKNPEEIFRRVSDYCKRDFTFPSDVSRAFEGIYQEFARMKVPVLHYHGVFLLGPNTYARERKDFNIKFIFGISWEICRVGSTKRRGIFPSWSWMEWKLGPESSIMHLDLPSPQPVVHHCYDDIDLLGVEMSNGELMPREAVQLSAEGREVPSKCPLYLYFSGLVFELELVRHGDQYYDNLGSDAWKRVEARGWQIFLEGSRPASLKVSCLILGHSLIRMNLMLMSKVGIDTYKRIGCHALDNRWFPADPVMSHLVKIPGANMRKAHIRLG